MTREEHLSNIDAATNLRLATWVPVQEAYRAQHGRYMQVLCSHSTIPADGNATVPDRLAEAPYYQQQAIADLGFSAEPLTAAFAVDQHEGPDGQGWTLSIFTNWAGVTYQRAIGHYAHSHSFDWRPAEASV
jgi:hypothetical protein